MISLTLPPLDEVRDIVLDLMPTITSEADPGAITDAVKLAENLVSLMESALESPIREAVLKAVLTGVVSKKTFHEFEDTGKTDSCFPEEKSEAFQDIKIN